jgi:hypothetical protein
LPILFAATAPDAKGGAYYGPQGLTEMKGPTGPAVIGKHAQDLGVARKLWDVSAQLTSVAWSEQARQRA